MMENLTESTSTRATAPAPGVPRSVAEALGQIVWLLTQSPLHREMSIKDLEWSVMPAILHEQFRIFRFGPLPGPDSVASGGAPRLNKEAIEQTPLGVALWAKLSAAAEAKLEKGEHLSPEEWRSGERVWLVELISPFANPENKISEAMLLDLMQGPFRGTPFNLHRTDPHTGRRDKICVSSHLKATQSAH